MKGTQLTFRSESANEWRKVVDFKAFQNIFIKQLAPGVCGPGAHSDNPRLIFSYARCVEFDPRVRLTALKKLMLSEATAR